MGDFCTLWMTTQSTEPKAFILLPEEVRSGAHRGEKDGRVSFWLQPKAYCLPQFEEAWHRIGRGS
jgi:hypothetical protein